jgi:ATP-dependent DNA helicase RecG
MPTPDWSRLQQALAVEAERGFNDLIGKQECFSQFLRRCLSSIPNECSPRCQDLAIRYGDYNALSYAQRQHLVAETRRTLYQLRRQQEEQRDRLASASAAVSAGIPEGTNSPHADSISLSSVPVSPPAKPAKRTRTTPLLDRSETQRKTAPQLDLPLTYLKGVGPRLSSLLAKLGLVLVSDLLYHFPRDYLDYACQVNIRHLEAGEMATLIGTVQRFNCFTSPRNDKLTILEWVVRDHSGQIRLSRFFAGTRYNSRSWQEQQRRLYPRGTTIAASGLVKQSKYGITLEDPEIEILDSAKSPIESLKVGRVVPIYPLTEGLAADTLRRTVIAALPAVVHLRDPLPEKLRTTYELIDLPTAIQQIHFPDGAEPLQQSRRRLIFDEFFFLQLGLLRRRAVQRSEQTTVVLPPRGEFIDRFYAMLPFQFTAAQQRVVDDILRDLQQSRPMNRLVQGDVGSGKTVVGVVALLAALQAGYQGALMAPTEVLAEQHYQKLVQWFNLLHLPVELLTGSTRSAKRREIHRMLETGELPLLVGTHALIQDSVSFHNLGLVVIDEQHRFGVEQRAKLQQKGTNPHVLTMTATPIPRTLALTLHGDLDVSQIDELPPGRQAIQTTALTAKQRPQAYDLMRREIAQGRQIYVVLPLVEESEKLDLKSAIDEHGQLQESIFPEFRVGLLHGRLSSAEKDDAISRFRQGETQILVSTTVVEVGVDVPNATVMLIEHAERFGLSQLHQLRGRVGRGAAQSYCLLMSSSRSETARQRLKVMEQSQDGFFIAEMDLRFRGPGEVLGKRQSGLPDFALASLVEDQDVLMLAREAAEKLIAVDERLDRWPVLRQALEERYRRLMGGTILT